MTPEQRKTVLATLATAEAQLSVAATQLALVRELVTSTPSPVVTLAEGCHGFDREACALVSEDARIPRGSFANRHAVRCGGCGAEGDMPAIALQRLGSTM